MKIKRTAVLLFALPLLAAGVFLYARNIRPSDEEIRTKFDCDRMTKELRNTDIYCNNPQLYRQHKEQGEVIKSR